MLSGTRKLQPARERPVTVEIPGVVGQHRGGGAALEKKVRRNRGQGPGARPLVVSRESDDTFPDGVVNLNLALVRIMVSAKY